MRLNYNSLIFLYFLFNFSSAYSQRKLDLFIKDNFEKPIPYASVSWNKNLGLVSDTVGYLQIPDKNTVDSLIITAIGYQKIILKKESIESNSRLEIRLQNSPIDLPEVIVAKYNIENDLGCTEKKQGYSYFKNTLCINLQSALLINSYNYPAQCKSISVFIAKQSSVGIPYRLRLYEIGEDSLPGKDLLSENLIVNSYKTNSWNTYNLDSITVQLPKNGFFVAIEWLCTDIKSQNGLCIGLTNKIDAPITYYKYGNIGWIQLKYKTAIIKDNIMLRVKIAMVK